jgi:hypothetical protein
MPEEHEQGEQQPFDDNPPVDPSEPQVGNSRARFFMPREEDAEREGPEGEGAEEDKAGEGEGGDEEEAEAGERG